jgi:hypothetical protein
MLFQPSTPIARLVDDQMKELHPGEFAVAHYRAYYAIEEHKERISSKDLSKRALNAVNCGSRLLPGRPILFASDSKAALDAIRTYAEGTNRSIIIKQNPGEALHLDIVSRGNASRSPPEFYDAFVDLLVIGNGRCVSHGTEGFGQFAQLLAFDSSCSNRKFSKGRMQECRWQSE